MCLGSEGDGERWACQMRQSPMIEMTMGKNQSQQVFAALQAIDLRMKGDIVRVSTKRQSEVEQNARTLRFQFDAASADLLGSPVYSNPHCPSMDAEASTLAGSIATFMWLLPVVF